MRGYKVDGLIRISKKQAKKRYDDGEIIYLCPYKLRPGQPWHPEIAVTKTDLSRDCGVQYFISNTKEFEKLVSDYSHYNCNWKVGEYPAYYIKG